MKELEILKQKDLKIKSNELVYIINQFRRLESEAIGKDYKELAHYDFYKKITKEKETLEALGISDGNISVAEYLDEQKKPRPCYELDKDAMLQMLNSESTLVRYKTIKYISSLENKILELQEENRKLELEAKDRRILRLESENQKVSKILQADRYIKSEMYGEETYITSIVINILKKCATKGNILKSTGETYFINELPVKEEYAKYKIKDADFKRYIEYFGGCKTKIKCTAKGGGYNIPIGCYSIPSFIIDWDMKDTIKRLS